MHRFHKTRRLARLAPARFIPTRKSWKRTLLGTAAALGLTLVPLPALAAQQVNDDTLLDVYHLLLDNHYSHPDENKLLEAAIQGMLGELRDPFTSYMSAEEYKDFINAINQSYAGIGVSLELDDNGGLLVSEVFADGPAAKAGLQAGDQIVSIDGTALTKDTVESAPVSLRGAEGTTVKLGILRNGQSMDVELTRESISLPEVGTADLGDGIAYIAIYTFGENTAAEFEKALADAKAANAKGIVLDLRDNGGGVVQQALTVADDLMTSGTVLIYHENGEAYRIDADAEGTDLPVSVLVNENTASASEMLAGALQRNGRAKLVGTVSYGKGTMQQPFELPNGSELKVSFDRWELPDGTSIDKTGLTPDVYLNRPEAQVNAAMQLLEPDRAQTLTLSRKAAGGLLNGTIELADAPSPAERNGQVFVPLRYAIESFGAEVLWDAQARIVHFEYEGKTVRIDARGKSMTVDGAAVDPADWFVAKDGTLEVSVRALQQLTGKAPLVAADQVTVYSR